MKRITCVVVSYRVRQLLRRCLETLHAQHGIETEIIVVDNASSDGSADMVKSEFPEVKLIRATENLGFARATNLGLAQSRTDHVALVNPDTELPPRALATAIEVFERHPAAGVVGLGLVNPDGSFQPACFAFPGLLNLLLESIGLHRALAPLGFGSPSIAPIPQGGEGEVDWVSGACMIVSRTAYAKIGGLDETRFMYGEEMDWCWRAAGQGFTTVFCDLQRVVHHGGASGTDSRGPLFVRNVESRVHFLRRHRGEWRGRIAREILFLGSLLRWVYWAARGRIERSTGSMRVHTREQVDRFSAVVAWRIRGA